MFVGGGEWVRRGQFNPRYGSHDRCLQERYTAPSGRYRPCLRGIPESRSPQHIVGNSSDGSRNYRPCLEYRRKRRAYVGMPSLIFIAVFDTCSCFASDSTLLNPLLDREFIRENGMRMCAAILLAAASSAVLKPLRYIVSSTRAPLLSSRWRCRRKCAISCAMVNLCLTGASLLFTMILKPLDPPLTESLKIFPETVDGSDCVPQTVRPSSFASPSTSTGACE